MSIRGILLGVIVVLLSGQYCSAQVRKVQMTKVGGVYKVPCMVNQVPMDFIFDTGASGISLSKGAILMLFEKGAIREEDFIGKEYYRIANGDVVEGQVVRLRSFDIAGVRVMDITASVSLSLNAPLLLGTDVLERFGNVSVDYDNNMLLLGGEPNRFMEEVEKLYRLHKYMWNASSDDVEYMEKSEKYRMKIITGSYLDWKDVNPSDGTVVLKYKNRVAGLSLQKTYTFKDGKLETELIQVLQEGLTSGNPDLQYFQMPLATAYSVYVKLDSMIMREASLMDLQYCVGGSAYGCVHNPPSEKAVYGQFFSALLDPMVIDDVHSFGRIMKLHYDQLNSDSDEYSRGFIFMKRRSTFNSDGCYDLCVDSRDGKTFGVWVVVRKRE